MAACQGKVQAKLECLSPSLTTKTPRHKGRHEEEEKHRYELLPFFSSSCSLCLGGEDFFLKNKCVPCCVKGEPGKPQHGTQLRGAPSSGGGQEAYLCVHKFRRAYGAKVLFFFCKRFQRSLQIPANAAPALIPPPKAGRSPAVQCAAATARRKIGHVGRGATKASASNHPACRWPTAGRRWRRRR